MKLSNMTPDYAQALLDVGYKKCTNLNSYANACYTDNTVAELLAPVSANDVEFCNEHWRSDGAKKWTRAAVSEAHIMAIGYAIAQALA